MCKGLLSLLESKHRVFVADAIEQNLLVDVSPVAASRGFPCQVLLSRDLWYQVIGLDKRRHPLCGSLYSLLDQLLGQVTSHSDASNVVFVHRGSSVQTLNCLNTLTVKCIPVYSDCGLPGLLAGTLHDF